MATITVTRTIPDAKIAEARHDIDMLNNPANLITFNDGYYAKSLELKWGMPPSEIAAIVKRANAEQRQQRKAEAATRRRASMAEMG